MIAERYPAVLINTPSPAPRPAPQKTAKSVWIGRILSGLAVAFLLLDALMKVVRAQAAVTGTVQLGYPDNTVVGIGVALLIPTLLYAMPQTALLGAIFVTGYLGGAVATHVRMADPLFTHVLFPVYVAALIWGGLYLRDRRLRALVPFRS
jgi:hypothetical protein